MIARSISRRRHHRGLSLLEVILAIAILGGCIAVIGEMIRIGSRQAEEARELTRAQILCEGTMEEIIAGILPAEAVSGSAYENNPDWTYSVTTNYLEQEGLIEVRVTVQQSASTALYPLTTTLTRWMMDPTVAEMEEELEYMDESSTTDAAASGGTGEL